MQWLGSGGAGEMGSSCSGTCGGIESPLIAKLSVMVALVALTSGKNITLEKPSDECEKEDHERNVGVGVV